MKPYNAGIAAKELRHDAYDGQWVTLRPTQEVQALPAPDGAELHNDDGSITVVASGSWLLEGPEGTLIGVPGDTIAQYYEVADGDSEAWQNTRDAFEGKDAIVQPQGPVPFADERQDALAAPAIELEGHEEFQGGAPADSESHDQELSISERARIAEEFRALATEQENRLKDLAAQAVQQKLVTTHEAAAWVQTGVIPDGVHIVDTSEGLKVSSEPDKVVEEIPGNEVIDEQGHPHSEKDDVNDPQELQRSENEEPDPFEGQSYRELQAVAKANEIPGGGGFDELQARLVEARKAGALPNVPK